MIKFYNIRSGETRVAVGEPHIAALWASSDRSPNITQGQDFGWRLAPETVVEMQRIMKNPRQMESIAVQAGIIPDNVTETDVLHHISSREDKQLQGMETTNEDFQAKYEAEIKSLQRTKQDESNEAIRPDQTVEEPTSQPVPTPEPVETPEDEPITEPVETPETDEPEESTDEPVEANPATMLEVDDSMSRAKLETVAKDLKIDAPSGFKNKGELVEAIKAKQASTS